MSDPFAYLRQDILDEDNEFRIFESEHDGNPAVVRFISDDPDLRPAWYWGWAYDLPNDIQELPLPRLVEAVGPFFAREAIVRTETYLAELITRGSAPDHISALQREISDARARHISMVQETAQAHMSAARKLVALEVDRLHRDDAAPEVDQPQGPSLW